MFNHDGLFLLGGFLREDFKSAVIKYIAVLINLHERGTLVCIGATKNFFQVNRVPVHGTSYKGAVSSKSQCDGIEGVVYRAHGSGLRDFSFFGSRRVLSLRQSVDFVVEQQQIDVEVATQQVNEMIASNGK